jgi:hypothetical protein
VCDKTNSPQFVHFDVAGFVAFQLERLCPCAEAPVRFFGTAILQPNTRALWSCAFHYLSAYYILLY